MHTTRDKKKTGIVIIPLTNREKRDGERGQAVRPCEIHRDKRNDYRRKPKHFHGW